MHLIPKWAPNIHPLIIHFPIALLIIAFFFDFLALVWKKYPWLSTSALILYVIGTGAAVLAMLTGIDAANSIHIPMAAKQAVSIHSTWAHDTVWFYSIFTIVRIYFFWEGEHDETYFKIGVFLVGFIGMYLLYETGDHGAMLVYKYGLGTPATETNKISASQKKSSPTTPVIYPNGGWSWEPGSNAKKVLKNDFEWIIGSESVLKPESIKDGNGNTLLEMNATGKPALFVFPQSMYILQTQARFMIKNFKGTIALTDHVENAKNYDFLALKNGKILQGRMINGTKEILVKKNVKESGWVTISLNITGRHHHVYMNGKKITQTIFNLKKPAPSGLYIDGKGKLLLKYYSARYIQ